MARLADDRVGKVMEMIIAIFEEANHRLTAKFSFNLGYSGNLAKLEVENSLINLIQARNTPI